MIVTSVRNGYIAQTEDGDYRIDRQGSQRLGVKYAVFSPDGEMLHRFKTLENAKLHIKSRLRKD